MGITSFYGAPLSEEAGTAVMEKAYELGVTHFDSAEVYTAQDANGNTVTNEERVGKFAAKIGRDKVTVATKYAPTMYPDRPACAPDTVKEAFEGSRKRLGLDYVDLYYLHRVPSNDALKSWMETCRDLVKEGKIKYLGLSEATAEQIRLAHAIHPLTAIQQEWSLLIRNLEGDLVPTCRELGIAIVAYSPMCRGFTSAQVKTQADWSKIGNEGGAAKGFQAICPHLSGDNVVENAKLLEPLEAKAKELGVTAAQLSLAWVQRQGVDVFPIPGTTKIANLESNVGACKLALDLPQDAFDALSNGVDWKKLQGDRYPERLIGACYDKK